MKRFSPNKKVVAVTLFLGGLAFFAFSSRFNKDPYQVFYSPDHVYSLSVLRYRGWFSMPGQSGDAPGLVILRDSDGRALRAGHVELVENIKDPEWTSNSVVIWNVLEWHW